MPSRSTRSKVQKRSIASWATNFGSLCLTQPKFRTNIALCPLGSLIPRPETLLGLTVGNRQLHGNEEHAQGCEGIGTLDIPLSRYPAIPVRFIAITQSLLHGNHRVLPGKISSAHLRQILVFLHCESMVNCDTTLFQYNFVITVDQSLRVKRQKGKRSSINFFLHSSR